MTEVIELAAVPGARATYRRAALGQLRRRSATGLPDTTLVLRGLAVDRAHLAAYNRVCGYRLADQLSPTYPHILAFPVAMRLMSTVDFPVRVVGVVHVANRIEVRRPIDAGERLELTVRAADLRPHERGRQFDVRATVSVDDEVVWRGVSTYLHKEKPSGPRAERERDPERAPAPQPTAVWRVGRDVGRRYAEVSGDHNPIHTSRLGARAFGFPRPIAHGMWSKARCLAALEGRLPDSYAVEVAFKLPILLPASVGFSAVREEGGDREGRDWVIGLHDAKSGRPHLRGRITA